MTEHSGQCGPGLPGILLIDDDQAIRAALTKALTDNGFVVHTAATALDALRWVSANQPDVVVLDLGLPDLDGTTVLRMLRGITAVPIVIATARDSEQCMVDLLNAGADDYVVKPFSTAQIVARVQAVLRRATPATATGTTLTVGGLRIEPDQHVAYLDGEPLNLNRREFGVLAYLAARPGTVVSRRELLREVWQRPWDGQDQTIDVHMSWLRRKLGESAANPRYLHTVRGIGVKLQPPPG
jgi:two-component system, OmpR family, KDP operon response regulator KdpE